MKKSTFLLPALLALLQLPAAVTLYPEAGGANLRVPVVAPVPGGADGNCVNFENVTFSYTLTPHFRAGAEGTAIFHLRDLPRRAEKAALVLSDAGGRKLEVLIPAASAGRGVALRSGNASAVLLRALSTREWSKFELRFGSGKATLTGGLEIAIPQEFRPVKMSVYAATVDELLLSSGGAKLTLDWESGYAARVEPAATGGVTVVFHGFDNFAVGTDPEKRDTPTLQLSNSGNSACTVRIDYAISSEIGKRDARWSDSCELRAGEELITPLKFPFELKSDIYHLRADISGSDRDRTERFHFFRAEPRSETAGPGLFGLHDCDVTVFGFWPDALPLRFAHKYLRWGYVVGPAWVRDWNGNHGIAPDTPPAEWNWNEKIDWEIASGRELYVCLYGTPLLDWQRSRPYEKMRKTAWGYAGGFPELTRYGRFVRTAAERYRGKVRRWEIENEPNASGHMPDKPEDYAAIARTAARELRAADPENLIYGISGTSTFVPWMKKVLAAGADMDAVSWHTYTTPRQPDRAGVAGMLDEAKKVAAEYGKTRFFNSETGVATVMRYDADRPIDPETVEKGIADRIPGFISKTAWPGRANDEFQASASMVKNAAINLLSGAEAFIFFGWNPKWPKEPEKWPETRVGFSLISATAAGERTPNMVTLAIGVLAAQFEGVLLTPPPRISNSESVRGGIFRKADGGEVALLWSAGRAGSALLSAPDGTLERVTLYGERSTLKPGSGGVYLVELSDQPVYLHAKPPGLTLTAPPVTNISARENSIRFTLENPGKKPWKAHIRAPELPGVAVTPTVGEAEIGPGGQCDVTFQVRPGADAPRELELTFAVELPGGGDYLLPVRFSGKPSTVIGKLAEKPDWRAPEFLDTVPALPLDKVEQAVIGRPPKLASLQEESFWGGPDELSGTVKLAYDAHALYIRLDARDANLRPPRQWPGVTGSSVELFFDLRRPGAGLGSLNYGDGVFQLLACPGNPEVYSPQLPGAAPEAVWKMHANGYTLQLRVPWKDGVVPDEFGFDLGINGVYPDKEERKTQLMLYGTQQNFRNASGFGRMRTKSLSAETSDKQSEYRKTESSKKEI